MTFIGRADGGELLVAVLFAIGAIIAISMIAAVFSDKRSQARLSAAARTAAHDAALEASPDGAMLAAQRAAAGTLTDLERFGRPMIVVDVSQFQTSGLVEVTVACTVAPRAIGPIDRAVQLRQATASASIHPGLARH
ncbi:MAG TPA: hypothetical protein VNO51_16950 [Ilumatobacteraceae bacterium]|nr:hypothetical protein [Ilumatobacteraceae bacterium]